MNIDYEDPVHAFKPTFFSNTTNGLSASTNYDAVGNITSVTKNGATVALKDSFTYNVFNDISSYINAREYKTLFSYNGSSNLTGITDALRF
ncbi:MAG: hypothetical protein IPP79_08035 [Chitinophagaceae bacterium]|nr:hypothetical protein [Chitinophagaceae bacterium]